MKSFAVLGLAAMPALAAPQLQGVAVMPNPVPFQADKTPEVMITVTIERPTPFDFTCDAAVDPGDGGRELNISWSVGDRRSKTTRHQYRKPGRYKLTVTGSGSDPCGGKREVMVTVRKPPGK